MKKKKGKSLKKKLTKRPIDFAVTLTLLECFMKNIAVCYNWSCRAHHNVHYPLITGSTFTDQLIEKLTELYINCL